MTPREQTQEIERAALAKEASLSENSKGRRRSEAECPLRTVYQRDRDRIIHSKAFRRLKQKTQVFLSPEGDHFRTRLTHTLEVNQIARTIARALRMNEDLTEAVALGHDLGHTPFGHAGERALAMVNPGGFQHNLQSARVVECLEKEHNGLNLTAEVVDGLACHTGAKQADTVEGRIVRYADRIAYINHDIEDAISAGVLKESDLPEEITRVLGGSKSERITTLITSLVENSKGNELAMREDVAGQYAALHKFMFATVYVDPIAKAEEDKVIGLLEALYRHFSENPAAMPLFYREIAESEGVARAVTDYISGMSDDYAVRVFRDLTIPQKWSQ